METITVQTGSHKYEMANIVGTQEAHYIVQFRGVYWLVYKADVIDGVVQYKDLIVS